MVHVIIFVLINNTSTYYLRTQYTFSTNPVQPLHICLHDTYQFVITKENLLLCTLKAALSDVWPLGSRRTSKEADIFPVYNVLAKILVTIYMFLATQ